MSLWTVHSLCFVLSSFCVLCPILSMSLWTVHSSLPPTTRVFLTFIFFYMFVVCINLPIIIKTNKWNVSVKLTFFLWSHWLILSRINELTLILKIIGQSDVKQWRQFWREGLGIHYPIRLAAILVLMSVSTFTTAIIIYIHSTYLISKYLSFNNLQFQWIQISQV